jgi:GTP-binding protein
MKQPVVPPNKKRNAKKRGQPAVKQKPEKKEKIREKPQRPPHPTRYLTSLATLDQIQPPAGKEVIFFGASNVGKSTLINALCRQKNLAKTSKTPGRTRMINMFLWAAKYILVDTPGYGFTDQALKNRPNWEPLLTEFLRIHHKRLKAYVLLDCRRLLRPLDAEVLIWLQNFLIPYAFVFTKIDKLTLSGKRLFLQEIEEWMGDSCEKILTSAKKKEGLDILEQSVRAWCESTREKAP